MRRVGGRGLLLAALIAQAALASEPAPLPEPELTEPFAIGEGLFIYEDFTADSASQLGPMSVLPFKADSTWSIEVERP